MKPVPLAKLLILAAILAQLFWLSGWLPDHASQGCQLASLALLFLTLFVLRKKRRRTRKRPVSKASQEEVSK
ncbi:hypothetical protein G3578_19525 [Brevibacillus sp. SYP-B805]|uniref:hypothetical protein n=1 Tax=Brevibacillus sp. SYP-B805 TaxID=1578199 RepID=UPI0013ECD370|nr:hypothetical protein [Brevibacillus sp. SYP-B805]NGQ97332.1 hypothetical protein [Brevibacillus sp. SYP-B805]